MSDLSEGHIDLTLHQQQKKVELLRRQAYSQLDPSASPALLEQLLEAEYALDQLLEGEQDRRGQKGRGVLLDTGGQGEKPGGVLLGDNAADIQVQVLLRMSSIPTGIVHLLDEKDTPLVTFRIKYAGDEYVRLRLTSFVEGYSAQAIDTLELSYEAPSAEVHQLPTFFPEKTRPVTEITRATLHIRIDDLDGSTTQHTTFHVWLLARTSAYLGLEDPATGEWRDLTPYLAAWVTPNEPRVMRLLRQAVEFHPRRELVGYQRGAGDVEAQLKAIFEAVKREEIQYVHSVLSYGGEGESFLQRVRLPLEAIENKSANCIDGTVLMASLLEAASLNPGIVLVPHHAFLAWEVLNDYGEWDYLETTMIGTFTFEEARQSGRDQAEKQKAFAERYHKPKYFRLHAIPDLRLKSKITPML